MKRSIVLTGILKDGEDLLIVQRSKNDDNFPGAWEFPGGHLEDFETIKDGLKRELCEEIGFMHDFNPIITNYTDYIDDNNIHNIEIDFIINVDKDSLNIKLSNEHIDYKWVKKDSELLDDFIKSKLKNI